MKFENLLYSYIFKQTPLFLTIYFFLFSFFLFLVRFTISVPQVMYMVSIKEPFTFKTISIQTHYTYKNDSYMKITTNYPSFMFTLQMFSFCSLGHMKHIQTVVQFNPHIMYCETRRLFSALSSEKTSHCYDSRTVCIF